jgi:hypothetical protein
MADQSPQFSLDKSFAGCGPIRPALMAVDAFDDRHDIGPWCDDAGARMRTG